MLMIGSPGAGKTLLASRLPTILPAMTEAEAIESAALTSMSEHRFNADCCRQRPFRAPHHTVSGVALVGGGFTPRPGEISLAHHNVLFLDELTEFDRRGLEVLREPLETGCITISRAARQAEFPARFQLIGVMNPCPQGYDCDLRANCSCTPEQQRRHRAHVGAIIRLHRPAHRSAERVARSPAQQYQPARRNQCLSVHASHQGVAASI
jgi:magnesium chelatase family protein